MKMFNTVNRYLILAFWVVFTVNIITPIGGSWSSNIMNVGLILILIHTIEFAVMYKGLKLIGRATPIDFVWVLLLGVFHWRPLLRK